MGSLQTDGAAISDTESNVRVWRTPGSDSKVIVEVHVPERGLQLSAFVRLLENQGFSSFRLSTVCALSRPHTSAHASCLRAEIDAQMSDAELLSFKELVINNFS
ncbi:hypothetical protein KP509_16G040000 [Ceratopteris richardii]|uniref:Uncharacterized protein n=1 Tax=Ceratopteris richardii TaxID=49495 RepID=A0A8T2T1C1_CERRI|nr:hypothetical protein KP509_16G040000 [Ceratopteris richardii]KAH7387764.1 hypothetical protein KP509_16G040000 [Ceratopteris richardii]